jgi:hypothetical protein
VTAILVQAKNAEKYQKDHEFDGINLIKLRLFRSGGPETGYTHRLCPADMKFFHVLSAVLKMGVV